MTPPRLAIFDFDGTIADSRGWFFGVMNEVSGRFGIRTVDAAEAEMLRGLTHREIIARLGVPAWKIPLLARALRDRAARDADTIRPFPWVADGLARLDEAGVAIAIVSSNAEAVIRRILGPETAARVTHWAAGASLSGKAARFRSVMTRAGVPPADATAVGDEVRDVEAAHAAGIAGLAVTWGYATASALEAAGPTRLVHTPDDLLAWFGIGPAEVRPGAQPGS